MVEKDRAAGSGWSALSPYRRWVVGVAISLGVGIAVGSAVGNPDAGIAVGAGIGMTLAIAFGATSPTASRRPQGADLTTAENDQDR